MKLLDLLNPRSITTPEIAYALKQCLRETRFYRESLVVETRPVRNLWEPLMVLNCLVTDKRVLSVNPVMVCFGKGQPPKPVGFTAGHIETGLLIASNRKYPQRVAKGLVAYLEVCGVDWSQPHSLNGTDELQCILTLLDRALEISRL